MSLHFQEYVPIAVLIHSGSDGAGHFQAGLLCDQGWYLTNDGRPALPMEELLETHGWNITFVWLVKASVREKMIWSRGCLYSQPRGTCSAAPTRVPCCGSCKAPVEPVDAFSSMQSACMSTFKSSSRGSDGSTRPCLAEDP